MLHKFTKIMTIYYTVLDKPRVTDVIFIFPFGLFFALMTQKIKIFKKWKNATLSSHDVQFLRYCVPWMDGQTDRQTDEKKWHIKVDDPPKKTHWWHQKNQLINWISRSGVF